jgi:hypothetical protein
LLVVHGNSKEGWIGIAELELGDFVFEKGYGKSDGVAVKSGAAHFLAREGRREGSLLV